MVSYKNFVVNNFGDMLHVKVTMSISAFWEPKHKLP